MRTLGGYFVEVFFQILKLLRNSVEKINMSREIIQKLMYSHGECTIICKRLLLVFFFIQGMCVVHRFLTDRIQFVVHSLFQWIRRFNFILLIYQKKLLFWSIFGSLLKQNSVSFFCRTRSILCYRESSRISATRTLTALPIQSVRIWSQITRKKSLKFWEHYVHN